MPNVLLFTIVLGFLSGILVGSNAVFGSITGMVLLLGILYFARKKEIDFSRRRYVLAIVLFCIACAGGVMRYDISRVTPPRAFDLKVGKTVTFTARISDDPDISSGKVSTVLYINKVGIRTSLKTSQSLGYGDTITVSGTLVRPKNFETDQGTQFDYVSYLSKDNIFYLIQNGILVSHTSLTSFSLTRLMYEFRHHVEAKLFSFLPRQDAGFVAGILLGTKTSIDQDLYDALIRTSTVHMIALSGYNVSIVAEGIAATLGTFLSPLVSSLTGALGIILFVIMTGATSTAIRAGFMALLLIFSRVSGRPTEAFRIVAIAAFALILWNPSYIVSDVSFQLSFLALLGLMIISPTYIEWFSRYIPKSIAALVGETLAAETAVAPFIIYKMGIFSIVSLPVNVAILPFIPYLMLAGFLLICIGFVVPFLGSMYGYPVSLFSGAIIGIITKVASLPVAAVTVPPIPLVAIGFFYILTTWYFLSLNLTKS